MKVFVTGASGFVGGFVCRELVAAGHAVTGLALPHESPPPIAGVRYARGDITAADSLAAPIAGHDAVIHLAGAVGYGQTWPVCEAVNVRGTRHVLAAARSAGIERFVHMSSVSVYGRASGQRLDESAPRRRIGEPYGDTKIAAEETLEAAAARNEIRLTMLRPTVIYGPGDVKFLGKLLPYVRRGRARMIGDGTNRVDLIAVEDVARAIRLALESPAAVGRTYNLNNPGNPDWRTLMAWVAEFAGVPAPGKRLPYPVAMALAAVLERIAPPLGFDPPLTTYAVRVVGRAYDYPIDRIRTELGFEPEIDLRAGLARALASQPPR